MNKAKTCSDLKINVPDKYEQSSELIHRNRHQPNLSERYGTIIGQKYTQPRARGSVDLMIVVVHEA